MTRPHRPTCPRCGAPDVRLSIVRERRGPVLYPTSIAMRCQRCRRSQTLEIDECLLIQARQDEADLLEGAGELNWRLDALELEISQC